MSRKWTNISFEFENRQDTISEASSNPRTQVEAFQEYIMEEWSEEHLPYMYDNIDLMFGHLTDDKLTTYISKIFEELSFLQSAGVVYVSDSAWQGFGYYYERDSDGTAKLVETYTEPEGCGGNSVADDISSEGILVNPDWAW